MKLFIVLENDKKFIGYLRLFFNRLIFYFILQINLNINYKNKFC